MIVYARLIILNSLDLEVGDVVKFLIRVLENVSSITFHGKNIMSTPNKQVFLNIFRDKIPIIKNII